MENIKSYKKEGNDDVTTLKEFESIIRNKDFVKTPYPTMWCNHEGMEEDDEFGEN